MNAFGARLRDIDVGETGFHEVIDVSPLAELIDCCVDVCVSSRMTYRRDLEDLTKE